MSLEVLSDDALINRLNQLDSERTRLKEEARVVKAEINRRSTEASIASKLLYGSQMSVAQAEYWATLSAEGRERIKKMASERVASVQQVIAERVAKL